jgi:hypothetical protein
MVKRRWPWDVLGIERTGEKAAIRRAYAERLKAMDLDADVGGYADLRHARDEGLRQATQGGHADEPILADELDDAQPDLPDYDGDGDDPDDDFAIAWNDIHPGPGGDFGYGTGEFADPDTTIADDAALGHDRVLAGLLYPGGEYSDAAFTHEEYATAQAALDALLAEAHGGDLGREQAIDHWLGELLAETWPRSAPLVEQASTAFDWLALSGQIGERPAHQFLNPRLRGMRFAEKVEQLDHPLHKAWSELKKPGRKGLLDPLRVKRAEIETLLGGIRTRYPEVESYLDAERVASWESPAPNWFTWALQRVFIFFVVFQALAFCSGFVSGGELSEAEKDQIVAEVFGPQANMLALLRQQSGLYSEFDAAFEQASQVDRPVDEITRGLVVTMRARSLMAQQSAWPEDVLRILEVKAEYLKAASVDGTKGCLSVLETAALPENAVMTEAQRKLERALAWRLAQGGLLSLPSRPFRDQQLPLPPWVGPGISERTGLSPERINAVLQGEKTEDFCAVRIALIETLLSRPDDAPEELLRIL